MITSALEILLPHIVAISPNSNINVSAIYPESRASLNSDDLLLIP
jgi:hypothetical protein